MRWGLVPPLGGRVPALPEELSGKIRLLHVFAIAPPPVRGGTLLA
jgi:hypothetical protein